MSHPNLLNLSQSAFVVIDMQEAFRPAMSDFAQITANIVKFTTGASLLGLPVVVTEQYPKGLGHTAQEILDALPDETEIIEKTSFSSCGASSFVKKLESLPAKQIIVAGIEAHICVNQTVHDLLSLGFQVHLLAECITSRYAANHEIAWQKMIKSGAIPCSIETAFFELMRDAKHEQFKAIQRLIK